MEIEVTKQNDAPLLSRKRVTAFVNFAATTPSRLELKFALGTQLKVNPDLVIIKHIYQRFGARRAKLIAHVYDKKELLEKLESEGLIAKHFKKVIEKEEEKTEEAPKAEDAPKEESTDKKEAPAEEKKEDAGEEKAEAPAEKSE